MNGLERVRTALAFGQPDRVPVIAQVFGHAAVLAGVPLERYLRDGSLQARCQLVALDAYGYDAVFALLDVNVESEALGSVLCYRPGQYARIDAYALTGDWDLERLDIPDPARAGRMPEVLTAATHLRAAVGDEVLVVGCVVGPMTLCCQLLGLETALYLAIDEPERFARLLDFATAVLIRYGSAQLEAGVHLPVVFDPAASAELIPPQFYREFALPRLCRLFAGLRAAGALAAWLHTAGQTAPILPFYAQAGVNLANIDYCVDPQAAARLLPDICISGNLRPLAFVEDGPAAIATAAAGLLACFAARGGFILSSGCEIPPEARPENIAALVGAARGGG